MTLRRFTLVIVLGVGLLAAGPAPTSTHRAQLAISPIAASFVSAESATHYTVPNITPAGTAVTYSWTLALVAVDPNRPTDPNCNNRGALSGTGPEFVWHHSQTDGCDHQLEGMYGHQGLITVVVSDSAGNRCTATYKGTTSTGVNADAASAPTCVAAPPPPTTTTTTTPTTPAGPVPVTSGPVTGTVTIKRPGQAAVPLTPGQPVPNGSLIDATHGRVTLSGPNGADVFYAGAFVVLSTTELAPGTKTRQPVVELRLAGGDFGNCRTTASVGKPPPKTVVRHVWGKGKGHFRTKGRYAAATVRGTFWLTEDRCDGTRVLVRQGKVEVRDLVKKKTVLLTPGQSYVATR